jgi:hypothetical protein
LIKTKLSSIVFFGEIKIKPTPYFLVTLDDNQINLLIKLTWLNKIRCPKITGTLQEIYACKSHIRVILPEYLQIFPLNIKGIGFIYSLKNGFEKNSAKKI